MSLPVPPTDLPELKQQLFDLAVRIDEHRKTFEASRDSRAVFTYTYVLITRLLADALETTGFDDPAWIVKLAEAFASRYIAAIESAPGLAPAWAVAFDAIRNKRTTVLEDLLFAITAHIFHDLPLALTDIGLKDANNVSRIHDFHQMNDVLGKNIQEIIDTVTRRYEPFFRWLDRLEERNARLLTDYGFRISRGLAWYNAERLLDPASKAKAESAINDSVKILVNDVRRPSIWSVRILLRALRWFASFFRRWPDPYK